jgi:hypothetical protein
MKGRRFIMGIGTWDYNKTTESLRPRNTIGVCQSEVDNRLISKVMRKWMFRIKKEKRICPSFVFLLCWGPQWRR